MTALTTVTLPQLKDILACTLSTDCQPILLLGSPGLAKTQFCRDEVPAILARARGVSVDEVGYIEFNAGQRDAVEVSGLGLPRKTADGRWETEFSKSALICMIEATGKQYGVLNLDELTQAGADMQKVLRPVMDSDTRTSGGDKLPAGWVVIATGNRVADKSGSTRTLSHLANACLRFELKFDFAAWRDWALGNNIHPLLIAAVEAGHTKGLFADAVPSEDVQYCTPRSLARAAVNMGAMAAANDGIMRTDLIARKLVEATVGAPATDRLFDFLEMHDKVPSGEEIQHRPTECLLPTETDLQYIASNIALSSAVNASSADRALQYICRFRTDLQIGVGSALLRKSAREGWMATGPTAQQFISKYADLLPLTG
jgi:hypothetical protein